MAALLEAWPAAVGGQIAQHAWPARIARDGTVHVNTTDSVWAFELGHREAEIAQRLAVKKIRFAPGPIPDPEEDGSTHRREPPQPAAEHREQAASLTAAIADESLREVVAKTAALSLARAAADRSV